MKRRDRAVMTAVAIAAGLLSFAVVAYIISSRGADDGSARPGASPAAAQATPAGQPQPTPAPSAARGGGSAIMHIFEMDQEAEAHEEPRMANLMRIVWRLSLAALLAAALAFRPRRGHPRVRRNLYVAQTQILLAVVASSLMMVVGDNAARAFGIFAAVSLVRFRTNIRDPKELTVLMISLALGLATGVGRWELAIILAVFVLPLLWLLEKGEPEQVERSMQLTVKTRDSEATQDLLREIFDRHGFTAEMRQIEQASEEEPVGSITYLVHLNLSVSTDEINEEILARDPENVEGIEWEQKKDAAYLFQ